MIYREYDQLCIKFFLVVWAVNFCNLVGSSIQISQRTGGKSCWQKYNRDKKTKVGYVNAAIPSVKAGAHDCAKTRIKTILAAHVASCLECIMRNTTCVKWMRSCDVSNRKEKNDLYQRRTSFPTYWLNVSHSLDVKPEKY